jgi:hypothetical protein
VAAQAKWARDAGVLPDLHNDDSDQFDSSNQTSRPGTAMSSQSQQPRTVSREATAAGTATAATTSESRGAKVTNTYFCQLLL